MLFRSLQRMESAVGVLAALLGDAQESALLELRRLSLRAMEADFDLEGANLLLSLWARLPASLAQAGEHEALVERIGMRFCTSKAMGEVMSASARRSEPALGVLHKCQARVAAVAEQAMEHVLRGNPGTAVQMLLTAGTQTLNAKLLEMTGALARRHAAKVTDGTAMAAQAAELMKRCCQPASHIAGMQRTGRAPGGLQLRLRTETPAAVGQPALAATTVG